MEQSDLGLHCLLRPVCPNTKNAYGFTVKLVFELEDSFGTNICFFQIRLPFKLIIDNVIISCSLRTGALPLNSH